MHFDVATLFAVTVFIMALGGLLLLFAWAQNRSSGALGWWGGAYLIMAVAMAQFGLRGAISDFWSINISNALFALGYGAIWSGARLFEGRSPKLLWTAAGAIVWLIACLFDGFLASLWARIVLGSLLLLTYSCLFIWELWRGRHDGLISRWPMMGIMAFHALLFVLRIMFVSSLPFPQGTLPQTHAVAVFTVFSYMFHAFSIAFLLLALAKERVEMNYKLAALTDTLTGVLNRRGFGERAERLIARSKISGTPLTLLMCDLDHFKSINDRFGHLTGDDLLVAFATSLTLSLRPLDLIGRLGGEEFVALMPGIPAPTMMEVAERVRGAFERAGRSVRGREVRATVSIGAASTTRAGYSLEALYAAADDALYRAKQKGRNRAEAGEAGPIVMADESAVSVMGDAPQRS